MPIAIKPLSSTPERYKRGALPLPDDPRAPLVVQEVHDEQPHREKCISPLFFDL